MEISIDFNKASFQSDLSDYKSLVAECSSSSDRELLLDLSARKLEPKRAPELLDFIGRSYPVLSKNAKFKDLVKDFFQNVIWKRFQKVVYSPNGTVGIDEPIGPKHVQTFLRAAKLSPSSQQYVDNIRQFMSDQTQSLV